MLDMASPAVIPADLSARMERRSARRTAVCVISFLTLVDLFAAQAVLPALAVAYRVSPASMGLAVNACTFGMAIAGIGMALFGHRIPRRHGIIASLTMLSIPTALLVFEPPLAVFAGLRVLQGVFMAAAFTLTMAYLAEHTSADDVAGALAAYVTGNVASNLVGRLLSAAIVDHAGLAVNFLVLAGLNLAGAALVRVAFEPGPAVRAGAAGSGLRHAAAWITHLRNPPLATTFAIGFLILFAFIGTFTYVNFVLVRAPLALSQMSLGLVYLVFLPALVATPLTGGLSERIGAARVLRIAFAAALAGLPLLLMPSLAVVLAGLALVGAGAFAAQAVATGFVARLAGSDRGAASGLYLAAYYLGGLAGSAVLGSVFDRAGWPACTGVIAAALALALALTWRLQSPPRQCA